MGLVNKERAFILFILVIISIVEFFITHPGILFFESFPNLFPLSETLSIQTNIVYSSIVPSNFYLIFFPISLLSQATYTFTINTAIFSLSFISMYSAVSYYSKHYTGLKNWQILIVSAMVAAIYPLYPFFGTGFYVVFDAVFPLMILYYDKLFSSYVNKGWGKIVEGSVIVAFTASLSVTDFRTIVYAIVFFLLFLVYYNLKNHSFRFLKKSFISVFISAAAFVGFDIRYILSLLSVFHLGAAALGSIVSLQLTNAYLQFPLIYSLAGTIQYYTTYSPNLILFGLIPLIVIAIALRLKFNSAPLAFLTFIIVVLAVFDSFGGITVNYILGQTSLWPYVTILYPTYLIAVLYYPILFLSFGISIAILWEETSILLEANTKGIKYFRKIAQRIPTNIRKRVIALIPLFIVVIIISSQIYYFQPAISGERNDSYYQSVPGSMVGAADYLYSHNVSGHVLDVGNFSGAYYDNSLLYPFTFSPQAGFGAAWFSHVVSQMESYSMNNVSRVLSYLGIEYIFYRYTNNSGLQFWEQQNSLNLVYHNASLYLFKNMLFQPELETHDGIYIAYSFPMVLEYLSALNTTYPVIPFYNVLGSSGVGPYIAGVVGYNLSALDMELLMLNSSNSYKLDVGDYTVNQLNGWQTMPIINSGDSISAIAPNTEAALNISLNVPGSEYQVIVVGGVSPVPAPSWNYNSDNFRANASLTISSGQNSGIIRIYQNNLSPQVQVYSISNFSVSGGVLSVKGDGNRNGVPFISSIYLVPLSTLPGINSSVLNFTDSHSIIDFTSSRPGFSAVNLSFSKEVYLGRSGIMSGMWTSSSVNSAVGTEIVSFSHSYIAAFVYIQDGVVSSEVFSSEYNYGAGFVYISQTLNATISYGDFTVSEYFIINGLTASAVAVILVYIRSRRKG